VIKCGDNDQDSKYLLCYNLYTAKISGNGLTDSRRNKAFVNNLGCKEQKLHMLHWIGLCLSEVHKSQIVLSSKSMFYCTVKSTYILYRTVEKITVLRTVLFNKVIYLLLLSKIQSYCSIEQIILLLVYVFNKVLLYNGIKYCTSEQSTFLLY
jgi:hypothetical protein